MSVFKQNGRHYGRSGQKKEDNTHETHWGCKCYPLLTFQINGDGGSRTRVQTYRHLNFYTLSSPISISSNSRPANRLPKD